MNKYMLGILLGAFVVCNAYADLYSALQDVYDSNPVIEQQRNAARAAAADVKSAHTGWQPYLGLTGNMGTARTKIGDYTFDYSPAQYGIEFQQTLFQGFGTLAQIKGARGALVAQRALLYATQQDVFLSAINAYIDVLNSGQVLKLNENNQRVLREYYDFVRDQASVGRLTKTDVASASARLEMAAYNVSSASAQYDNALETFRRIYGDTLTEYPDISLTPVADLFPESVEVAMDVALQTHPTLLALAAQESAARENIVVARKSMLPRVDVRGAVQQMDDLPYVDKLRDSRIGLYISVPIYDRGNAVANVERVRYTVAGIQDQIINARRVIVENLRSAWNMYDAQDAAISAADASVRAAKMALGGTRDEQVRGRRTVLDVLDAEQEVLQSQVALTRAKHARIAAYFAILAATGKLTPENLGLVTDEE
ncbi:MAG: TolC family outer membrane protein [Alphaproteobacteria bacterium]|nr:TolC family outer membrane protein [Alphaproteobacteria bacterium]